MPPGGTSRRGHELLASRAPAMTQPNSPGAPSAEKVVGANLNIQGGAAIVAPVSAFQGGIPQNALIVLPLKNPTDELLEKMKEGAIAVTPEKMWSLLGFNGPAVQVQDNEGRPIAIGLEDLLGGLEKHWKENQGDLNRGRIYSQELMKYGRPEQAEKVLSRVVASGGTAEDWLALGVAQIAAEHFDKAESTLKGAQNLLPGSPIPALQLARVYGKRDEAQHERTQVEKAISIDPKFVDAWAYLYTCVKRTQDETAAIAAVEELAAAATNAKCAAPYVALQGYYSADEETRPKAEAFAKKALEREPDDALALVSLSAIYGQRGDLAAVIELLKDHQALMIRDVRVANNYFEALFQSRDIDKVTKLLNALAGSQNAEVKRFAIERSRMVAQLLQQQQQQVRGVAAAAGKA